MRKSIRLVAAMSTVMLLTSCANMSAGNLFSHYSAQNKDVYQAVEAGRYNKAVDALPDHNIAGPILDNMERGRVYYLDKKYPQSMSSLKASDQAVKKLQNQPVISISDTATDIGSLAANDNLNQYQPADYELGFLHLYLGLNYLNKNDLSGALVEMRQANQVQMKARQDRASELRSAQKQMQSEGISPNLGSVLANYPNAGKVLGEVQNAYLFYLSALLYETSGDLNDAYVDYRRALAVMPNNQQVINGTIRVANMAGMNQDLQLLIKRYGEPKQMQKDQARVIVIEEEGEVEARQEWKLSVPLASSSGGAIYSLSLPYYPKDTPERFAPLNLNGQSLPADKLADVNAMAKNDLSERLPTIIIRQILRIYAKDQIRREAAAKGGDISNLLLNLWNTFTEQADTRSWQTLPRNVYTASRFVEAGEQSINAGGHKYTFNVQAGHTVLVWISRQGGSAVIWHKQLGRLE
ncbi:hypothetical protein M9194_12715 [Vibrio sp. S4M6]|uniref:COG3014 family protein n=1 Tax=Vibrio sinus TaxID=2946865 RepID=UPI002029BD1D|nr:hypothetical protein [Vibrio sinus]